MIVFRFWSSICYILQASILYRKLIFFGGTNNRTLLGFHLMILAWLYKYTYVFDTHIDNNFK